MSPEVCAASKAVIPAGGTTLRCAATDATVTTAPPGGMRGSTPVMRRRGARRLTASTRAGACVPGIPATLATASTWPGSAAMAASMASASARSHTSPSTPGMSQGIRSSPITVSPEPASVRASAAPMPAAAPVTRAVRLSVMTSPRALGDAHRQALDAAEEVAAQPGGVAVQVDGEVALDQPAEEQPCLEPGQVRPEARVHSPPEAHVLVRAAAGDVPVGGGEYPFVPVGGAVPHHHLVAGAHRAAVQLQVARCRPAHGQHRCHPADEFLHKGGYSLWLPAHECPLVRVVVQGDHRTRQQIAGRLVARHHEDQVVRVELAPGQR